MAKVHSAQSLGGKVLKMGTFGTTQAEENNSMGAIQISISGFYGDTANPVDFISPVNSQDKGIGFLTFSSKGLLQHRSGQAGYATQ